MAGRLDTSSVNSCHTLGASSWDLPLRNPFPTPAPLLPYHYRNLPAVLTCTGVSPVAFTYFQRARACGLHSVSVERKASRLDKFGAISY